MSRIAAVTIVRDSEKFIIPHLKMFTGVARNIVLFISGRIQGGANGHSDLPDSSEELIKKYCPEVEIYRTENKRWGADLFNEALSLASDCDKVVTLHADVILTQKDWQKLLTFLKETDYDVYKLNMPVCTINYYYDFLHGIRDCLDIEPIAAKPTVRYSHFYSVDAQVYTIDWPDFTAHHFTGWKGYGLTQAWLDKEGQQTKEWLPCPKEIKDAFDESRF